MLVIKLLPCALTIIVINRQPWVCAAGEETIKYEIKEQVPIGTKIGNLLHDSGLRKKYSKDILSRLEFRFLVDPLIPISIGASDGVVQTRGVIDRDVMPNCRHKDTCEIYVDFTVEPVRRNLFEGM